VREKHIFFGKMSRASGNVGVLLPPPPVPVEGAVTLQKFDIAVGEKAPDWLPAAPPRDVNEDGKHGGKQQRALNSVGAPVRRLRLMRPSFTPFRRLFGWNQGDSTGTRDGISRISSSSSEVSSTSQAGTLQPLPPPPNADGALDYIRCLREVALVSASSASEPQPSYGPLHALPSALLNEALETLHEEQRRMARLDEQGQLQAGEGGVQQEEEVVDYRVAFNDVGGSAAGATGGTDASSDVGSEGAVYGGSDAGSISRSSSNACDMGAVSSIDEGEDDEEDPEEEESEPAPTHRRRSRNHRKAESASPLRVAVELLPSKPVDCRPDGGAWRSPLERICTPLSLDDFGREFSVRRLGHNPDHHCDSDDSAPRHGSPPPPDLASAAAATSGGAAAAAVGVGFGNDDVAKVKALLADPNFVVLPYCVSFATRTLVLVQHERGFDPVGSEGEGSAFLFTAQRERVRKVVALSWGLAMEVADSLPVLLPQHCAPFAEAAHGGPAHGGLAVGTAEATEGSPEEDPPSAVPPQVPPPLGAGVLFLQSTGRCGSTVLCKALGWLGIAPTVLSEPDFFGDVHEGLERGLVRRGEAVALLRCCLVLCLYRRRCVDNQKANNGTGGGGGSSSGSGSSVVASPLVVVKPRSLAGVWRTCALLPEALPGCQQVMLWRRADDVAASFDAAVAAGMPSPLTRRLHSWGLDHHLWPLLDTKPPLATPTAPAATANDAAVVLERSPSSQASMTPPSRLVPPLEGQSNRFDRRRVLARAPAASTAATAATKPVLKHFLAHLTHGMATDPDLCRCWRGVAVPPQSFARRGALGFCCLDVMFEFHVAKSLAASSVLPCVDGGGSGLWCATLSYDQVMRGKSRAVRALLEALGWLPLEVGSPGERSQVHAAVRMLDPKAVAALGSALADEVFSRDAHAHGGLSKVRKDLQASPSKSSGRDGDAARGGVVGHGRSSPQGGAVDMADSRFFPTSVVPSHTAHLSAKRAAVVASLLALHIPLAVSGYDLDCGCAVQSSSSEPH